MAGSDKALGQLDAHGRPGEGVHMGAQRKPRLGLVLGGGSARGWAHVGVIRALEAAGIRPDLVCGTSVGALVGAAYAAGELDRFEKWLLGMRVTDVVGFMDVSLNGGLLKGERLMEFLRHTFVDRTIEDLQIPFGAVSTALHSGTEVWLRDGSTVDAVRASIALPALFTPVLRDGAMLVDGGLVNPVPVSLARAMGAEVVIAVDLNSAIMGRRLTEESKAEEASDGAIGDWIHKLQENLGGFIHTHSSSEHRVPSMLDVLAASLNIMQVRITRSRMAGDPPDLIVSPRLGHLGRFDFHRAREAIDEGRRAMEAVVHSLPALGDRR